MYVCMYVCMHNRYVYLYIVAIVCEHGDVRLVDGANYLVGLVSVCVKGLWDKVCSDRWDLLDSAVVCRQLGHLTSG